ncbi:MAG: glycosyltransferase [Planctomycetota bacterium]
MEDGDEPRPRVLMLTHRVPWPPDRGDRVRSWHVLREMSGWAEVWLASVDREGEYTAGAKAALHAVCERVHAEGVAGTGQRAGAAVRGAMGVLKGSVTAGVLSEPGLVRVVKEWLAETRFDWVYVFCSGMWGVVERAGLDGQGTPHRLWVDLVDIDSAKWRGLAERLPRWDPKRWVYAREADQISAVERRVGALADRGDGAVVSVISEREREVYNGVMGGPADQVVVLGNGVDLEARPELPDAGGEASGGAGGGVGGEVVFVGVLDYGPNVEAVRWLAERVWPRVINEEPGAVLRVVGRSPGTEVLRLGGLPGVEVVGPVADVVEGAYLGAVAASAPLRVAPGVQNKVLEAMACGRAVVCSSAAAAGIDAAPGRELLVADDEAEHARVLVRLMRDGGWRRAIGSAARARVEASYAWSARLAPLRAVMAGR